jgi:DNA-binding transcriptional regulator YhcF (GntR family)
VDEKVPIIVKMYGVLKDRLRTGVYLPGDRLDANHIGREFSVSHTPVREALGKLSSEVLVEAHIHKGYFVPRVSEKGLRDLYEWHLHLLLLALQLIINRQAASWKEWSLLSDTDLPPTALTETLFMDIGLCSGNPEITRAITNVNDRLHWMRVNKGPLLLDQAAEIEALAEKWRVDDFEGLRDDLITYHRRRQFLAEDIVALMHRCEMAARLKHRPGRKAM